MTKSRLYDSPVRDQCCVVHFSLNLNSSAHNCGCVVDGGGAMAAIFSIIILLHGVNIVKTGGKNM